MRLKFDTTIPTKKSSAGNRNKRLTPTDHQKLLASLNSIRESIEASEKKFKGFLQLKRRMQANAGKKGLLEDALTIEDLISRSETELEKFKNRKIEEIEDKSKNDQAIEDELQRKITKTQIMYERRRAIVAAGPKFIRHSFSPFGNVLCLSAMNKEIFAVFTTKAVEIWKLGVDNCEIIEAYELPPIGIVSVIELYRQDTVRELDLLEMIPNHDEYIKGIKEQLDAADKRSKEPEKIQVHEGFTQPPHRERSVLSLEEIRQSASSKVNSNGTVIDWDNYVLADVPKVDFRFVFFFGTKGGDGGILELVGSFSPLAESIVTFKLKIRARKNISSSPVQLAYFYYTPEGTPVIATEVTSNQNGQILQAMRLNLEVEWYCKVDTLRLTMYDRCTRYISKEQNLNTENATATQRLDAPLVTAYCFDSIHGSLLLGTSNGTLLRFFFQKEAKEKKEADANLTPGKVMWCLQISPLSYGPKKDEIQDDDSDLEDVPDQRELKIVSVCEMTHPTKFVTSLAIGTTDGIIRLYPNDNLKCTPRPKIFFADKFQRADVHSVFGKRTPKFQDIFDQRQIGCMVDYLSTTDGVLYILVITTNNTLVIYDPYEADEIYVEVEILSFAIKSGKISEQVTKTTPDPEYHVKVLDCEKGLCTIFHGKHWSIVSLKDAIEWRKEQGEL